MSTMPPPAASNPGLRPGEIAVSAQDPADAALRFIGRIRTPWATRDDCPRQGRTEGPVCRIEVFEPWAAALAGIETFRRIEVIYWMHLSRRDLVRQSPHSDGATTGTFALRSPVRPNPIATALVELVGVDGATLLVRGLDCVDGTPLLDLKPDRCAYTPPASPAAGDAP